MRLLGGLSAGKLEGRKRPGELRMRKVDMGPHLGQQRVFVLGLQDLPAPALDDGCHPADRTV
jgi:hypothetical protein